VTQDNDILKGRTFICTYPEKTQDELIAMLSGAGAKVFSMPVIEISPLPFQLKKKINEYDWLIFTSKNAVQPFASRYPKVPCKIAALGEQTARKLEQFDLPPVFTGSGKSAPDFVNEFLPKLQDNEKVLVVLGNLAPDTLQQKLGIKALVDRVNVYQTNPAPDVDAELLNRIEKNQYDALIVTSPSAVRALIQKLKTTPDQLRFISIGIATTAEIRKYKAEPLATAIESSYKGLAETTINFYQSKIKI
jgi:uroporphyrinogen-III synthase